MRQAAQGWCTGMTLRDGVGREVGVGFKMGNTGTSMSDSCQCMAKPTAAAAKVTSVVSDSVRPHRWQPSRLLRPWNSPSKNTGVGCHFLLQSVKVKSESEVTQSCLTLRDPMDCSLPGSSVHRISQARVLEWVAIAFSGKTHCNIVK